MMTLQRQGVDVTAVAVRGQLVIKRGIEDANWSDLFKGEEAGNAGQIDLGKIQLFYFTLILVGTYAVALGKLLHGSSAIITSLPDLDQSVLVLLGLSHAGYLTSKVLPHTQPPDGPAAVLASDVLPAATAPDASPPEAH